MTADENKIRDTILELIPGVGDPFLVIPDPGDVAAKAGADPQTVKALMATTEATLEFLLAPLSRDAERVLSAIPIRRNPTLLEQRELMHKGIKACMRNANQIRLLLLLVDRMAPATANRLADTVMYSTVIRLVGIDNENDPVIRRRVALAWELASIAVISHRHGLEADGADEDTLNAVTTACLGILHPPEMPQRFH